MRLNASFISLGNGTGIHLLAGARATESVHCASNFEPLTALVPALAAGGGHSVRQE